MKRFLIILGLLALPLAAFAHEDEGPPGTDTYLKEVLGWSELRLTTAIPTEGRQTFDVATGESLVDDPLGDVLNNFGVESKLSVPWGDISGASLVKNTAKGTWDFQVSLGADVPAKITDKAVLFIYADADGKPENDSPDPGVKLGMDSEFAIQHNVQKGWYAAFRWYNPAPTAKTWATNKTTKATFKISKDVFSVSIPFAEIPKDAVPHWRVAMAIQNATDAQIDVAPTDGFPDAKGAATTTPPSTPSLKDRLLGIVSEPANDIVLAAIVLGLGYLLATKRKKAPPSDPQP